MIWVVVAVLVLGALAVAVPAVQEARRGLPDTDAAPGRMRNLPQGATHARWIGPVRGPVAVAVHGLTTPSPVFDDMAAALGRLGYRVLVYDLYGRGYSANAAGRQDAGFFTRQLLDLLEAEGLHGDVTLIGYSLGGAIATAFAAAHPDRVNRLILIAPAGIVANETRAERLVRTTPVIGDWIFAALGTRRLRRLFAADPAGADLAILQEAELARRGYLRAVLSSLRHLFFAHQEDAHRAIGRAGIPVAAVWGADDGVIPLRAVGILSAWNRAARQEVIPGAGHGLPFSHPQDTVAALRAILREDA